jgi:transcription elongation factor GreA
MKEQLEKLVTAGKLSRQNLDGLVKLAESGYCLHKTWGVGKILAIDTVFARMTIDFKDKKGHTMELNFAVQVLKPIPKDHILAKKLTNLDELKKLAATNHKELVKLVLKSFGNKATALQIQQVLVPDVIPDDWKKWWETAKLEIKEDGHFILPRKINEPIIYTETVKLPHERLIEDFYSARGLKARVQIASEILKNLNEFPDNQTTVLELTEKLNSEITTHQRTQPGVAIEAIFVRDDLLSAVGIEPPPGSLTVADVWSQSPSLALVLEQMPAPKHRRLLNTFKIAYPEKWRDILLETINNVPWRLVPELAHILMEKDNIEVFKDYLSRLINQHTASSDLLYWVAKELTDKRLEVFSDIIGAELLRAMLAAIERDILNEKKTSKLADILASEPELVLNLLKTAELDVIKDITRSIKIFAGFEDMDRRALLGRIVKTYPSLKSLLTRETSKHESVLIVSWESLEKKKKEYDELVQKKIPQNSRDIAHARSYGDLSENHEYKAAKEAQKLLLQQKYELEKMLAMAQGTDFSNPNTEVVSIGTRVELTDLSTMRRESYSILGAWDFDEEKGIISYLSPMAKAMLGKKPGETFEFGAEPHKTTYRIESIKAAFPQETINTPQTFKAPSAPEVSAETTNQLPPVDSQSNTASKPEQTTIISELASSTTVSGDGAAVKTFGPASVTDNEISTPTFGNSPLTDKQSVSNQESLKGQN